VRLRIGGISNDLHTKPYCNFCNTLRNFTKSNQSYRFTCQFNGKIEIITPIASL